MRSGIVPNFIGWPKTDISMHLIVFLFEIWTGSLVNCCNGVFYEALLRKNGVKVISAKEVIHEGSDDTLL